MLLIVLLSWSTQSLAQQVDPTKPFQATTEVSKNKLAQLVKLQSIINVNHQFKAVINGQLMRIGDVIEGYKLTAISKTSVVLTSEQKTLKLSMFHSVTSK